MATAGLGKGQVMMTDINGLKIPGSLAGMKLKLLHHGRGNRTGNIEDSETALGLSVSFGPWTIGGNNFTAEENNEDVWDVTHIGVQYKLSKATVLGIASHDQTDDSTAMVTTTLQ